MSPKTGHAVDDATPAEEAKVLQEFITKLAQFGNDSRRRLMETIATYYGLSPSVSGVDGPTLTRATQASIGATSYFSGHEDISPKDFLREKHPLTDVERVACLAFYLAHYRGMRHFKTLDISKINTEAAQPKFSNPSLAVSNAMRTGYVTDAAKGSKQISSAGEQFVLALPDREAAKEAMHRSKPRRGKRPKPAK